MRKPEILELSRHFDPRGNLSVIEELKDVPFKIKRTYWVYDVPGGEERWGRAFHVSQEFIVSLSGSFDVVLDDGIEKKIFTLNRSYYGLYVPSGYWRVLQNFSTNSVALVISSTQYDERDYVRDYGEFVKMKKNGEI